MGACVFGRGSRRPSASSSSHSLSRHSMLRYVSSASFLVASSCRRASSIARSPRRTPAAVFGTHNGKQRAKQANDRFGNLEAYVLSKRLRHLCTQGNLTQAIGLLKATPRDAQNVVVWNTVIVECMKSQKYTRAYTLFVDVSIFIMAYALCRCCVFR